MAKNYKVFEAYLETIDFTILIFEIPETELNDKLAYFAREKGLIAKSLYHDFLIANFVSNIHPLLQHMEGKNGITKEQLNDIRLEVIDKVLEVNPKLTPSNLIINQNHVLKVKEGRKKKGEKLLSENADWNIDKYKSDPEPQNSRLDTSKIEHVQDLNYIKIQKFWVRINEYITIKQFEPGSEIVILGNRSFGTRYAFEQYVVTVCIDEVEDLFMRLDKIGLPQRIDPTKIVHEIYELCKKSNPFLDFDVYRDTLAPEELSQNVTDDDAVDPFESFQAGAQSSPEELLSEALKKKKLRLFRDVEKEKLLLLGDNIKKRVLGQDKPIDDLVDAIQRASVGLKDPDQPIGSFIFTGYTGVGKSYTAKILAEELTGSKHGLITIDCSEYAADHEYAKLIGAPTGYIGHEQGGHLTNAIKKNPFSIVLFDEIEKASEKVYQLLLQIMEEARLTDGKGKKVSFKDAVVIMTSNIGVKEVEKIGKTIGFGSAAAYTKEKRLAAVKLALKKKFKPEFLNRVTYMVDFDPLEKKTYLKIIGLELEKLKKNLKLNKTPYSNLEIEFDKSLYNYVYNLGIDEKFGARPLLRTIEQKISTPLARKLLKENIDCDNTKLLVSIKKGEVVIKAESIEKIDNPPFYMEAGNGDE